MIETNLSAWGILDLGAGDENRGHFIIIFGVCVHENKPEKKRSEKMTKNTHNVVLRYWFSIFNHFINIKK